jgi:hypothetical protein
MNAQTKQCLDRLFESALKNRKYDDAMRWLEMMRADQPRKPAPARTNPTPPRSTPKRPAGKDKVNESVVTAFVTSLRESAGEPVSFGNNFRESSSTANGGSVDQAQVDAFCAGIDAARGQMHLQYAAARR